jgi:hypothetical protein
VRPEPVFQHLVSRVPTDLCGWVQGATCYLNSLLQTLFHTRLLRMVVYQVPLSTEELEGRGSVVKALQEVRGLHPGFCHPPVCARALDPCTYRANVGLAFCAATWFFEGWLPGGCLETSVFPLLGSAPWPDFSALSAFLHPSQLFYKMETHPDAVSTKKLTESFGWTDAQAFQQHDLQVPALSAPCTRHPARVPWDVHGTVHLASGWVKGLAWWSVVQSGVPRRCVV